MPFVTFVAVDSAGILEQKNNSTKWVLEASLRTKNTLRTLKILWEHQRVSRFAAWGIWPILRTASGYPSGTPNVSTFSIGVLFVKGNFITIKLFRSAFRKQKGVLKWQIEMWKVWIVALRNSSWRIYAKRRNRLTNSKIGNIGNETFVFCLLK